MQNSTKGPLRFFSRFRMHPTNADLLAFRDQELPRGKHARIDEHLQHCERCQKAALAIEADLLLFTQMANAVEVPQQVETGLLELQRAMDDRSAAGPDQAPPGMERPVSATTLACVRKELAIYLGAGAAEMFMARMETTTFSVEELVASVGPLMAGLLGSRGGSAVAGRIALLCGSNTTDALGLVTQ